MARSNGFRLGRLLGSNTKLQASVLTVEAITPPQDFTYSSLTGTPTLFDGAYGSLSGIPSNIVTSDISGTTGADVIGNIVSLTQADYDAIATPDSTTLYVITG